VVFGVIALDNGNSKEIDLYRDHVKDKTTDVYIHSYNFHLQYSNVLGFGLKYTLWMAHQLMYSLSRIVTCTYKYGGSLVKKIEIIFFC